MIELHIPIHAIQPMILTIRPFMCANETTVSYTLKTAKYNKIVCHFTPDLNDCSIRVYGSFWFEWQHETNIWQMFVPCFHSD